MFNNTCLFSFKCESVAKHFVHFNSFNTTHRSTSNIAENEMGRPRQRKMFSLNLQSRTGRQNFPVSSFHQTSSSTVIFVVPKRSDDVQSNDVWNDAIVKESWVNENVISRVKVDSTPVGRFELLKGRFDAFVVSRNIGHWRSGNWGSGNWWSGNWWSRGSRGEMFFNFRWRKNAGKSFWSHSPWRGRRIGVRLFLPIRRINKKRLK